ncbi:MAG: response regulator transcription factor [Chloroflexi bacterium]|nr:response regulator transcription factor [Chloroflexota bacterium]
MSVETILVVDDDPQIVRLLGQYLQEAGYRVLTAVNGEEALRLLYAEKPAMLILDLGLPDRDGWDVTRIIRGDSRVATIPIIMLTARIDDADKIIGLELGADDYIPKPFNAREVVARIRAVLRRRQWDAGQSPPLILRSGGLELDVDRRTCVVDGLPVELTPTEFKLLQMLMQSPGATFHREELLEKALGYGYEGQGRTLDSHIKNLRQKIEPDPGNPTYIVTVYRVGYRFVDGR